MTRTSDRRSRLLRLRSIEHRLAAIRLADADSALNNLVRVRERLAKLRSALVVGEGQAHGRDILAMAELAQRLENAQAQMRAPADQAERLRAERQAERIAARMREEGAAKLHVKALSEEAVTEERRTDSNRQYVKRKLFLRVE